LKASGANPALLSCAVARGSIQICTTNGAKSFWSLESNGLPGTSNARDTSSQGTGLKQENQQLKELVADLSLKNVVLKKSLVGSDLDE